ncbi:type VI secretion system tube protein Hcp [Roseomonas rosulenta]|uniref:type VI secretion system tube protein Hcp n=1 Tax=Roseomonas rosulenta TaxID=2748667 RepID=UPI0018DF43BB|nr:type VI secretion system tube protein Hcp [Roseomonas rosulenta]
MPILMSIDGINGPGVITGYEGWLLLNSFKWGGDRGIMKQAHMSGRMASIAVAPQLRAVQVTRSADIVSPEIWLRMLSMTRKRVQFAWLRTGSDGLEAYLKLELTDALITSMGEKAGSGAPDESIELTYTKVTLSVVNVGNSLGGPQDVVSYTLPQAQRA